MKIQYCLYPVQQQSVRFWHSNVNDSNAVTNGVNSIDIVRADSGVGDVTQLYTNIQSCLYWGGEQGKIVKQTVMVKYNILEVQGATCSSFLLMHRALEGFWALKGPKGPLYLLSKGQTIKSIHI